MTVLEKWKAISLEILESNLWDINLYPKGYQHFVEAFAINEEELPLLCILEVKEFITFQDLVSMPQSITKEEWTKSINKLLWLDWLVPALAYYNVNTFTASTQYQLRLQLWNDIAWEDTETGLQPGFPMEEDMSFPMKKEVYECKLEKLSDDLQGEQLNYFEGSMFEDELDEEDLQLMEKQKAFVTSLLQSYQNWKEYIPKYYLEKQT